MKSIRDKKKLIKWSALHRKVIERVERRGYSRGSRLKVCMWRGHRHTFLCRLKIKI